MTEARFTLTLPGHTHAAALALADAIEADPRLDPLAVTINETDEHRGLWEVVLYVAERDEAEAAALVLRVDDAQIAPVPQADWVRQSLEGLAPVTAGRFFLHGSHDRHRRRSGGVSLEIDAGTAFGTGHHGTTEGCLLALDSILKQARPRRILDVGCGTGVLAIAAARAAGRAALATDIDPEAVRVTLANARRNGVGHLIRSLPAPGLKHRAIAQGQPYDLIFANILARPLIALAHGLSGILEPGGQLVLSGLTRDQTRWIAATYRNHGLVRRATILRGNWATLLFTRPRKRRRPGGRRKPGRLVASAIGAGWQLDR